MQQLDGGKMTATTQDRRVDRRIEIALPVFLDDAIGITRDVSRTGVFFWTDRTYDLGESISFSMGRRTESEEFVLKCRGVVFRTEPNGYDVGVAVRITDQSS